MKGTLYGIGVGPGDPELLTLKAVKILAQVDAVVVPQSRADRESIALDIVRPYIAPATAVVALEFPMTADPAVRQASHEVNAASVAALLDEGKSVAFLTLGDAFLYSTYGYIVEILLAAGYRIETVPGITSFSAIAARANLPLVRKQEVLSIVPLEADTDIDGSIARSDTVVFLKVSAAARRLAEALRRAGSGYEAVIASKCGGPGELITGDASVLEGAVPYLTTVIVKKKVPEEHHG